MADDEIKVPNYPRDHWVLEKQRRGKVKAILLGLATGIGVFSVLMIFSAKQQLFQQASRIEFPNIPAEAYFPILQKCIDRLQNPNVTDSIHEIDHPPIRIDYAGNLTYVISWRGRSGNLSLGTNAFAEAVQLRMRLVRDFKTPTLVVADLDAADARQVKWEPTDPIPDDRLFNPFDAEQLRRLDLYTNYLSSYLTNCSHVEAIRYKFNTLTD